MAIIPRLSSPEGGVAFGLYLVEPPIVTQTIAILMSLISASLGAVCFFVFGIYIDCYIFVISSSVLQFGGFDLNNNFYACQSATILCLVGYISTKLIYLFLVDRAHTIRARVVKRFKSKLYLFNSFGMVGMYCVFFVMLFVFRINVIEDGLCIIGVKGAMLIAPISFEIIINIYLTTLFLIPLVNGLTFVFLRNLAALMALDGEPAWLCVLCCKTDTLFSMLVIHWITVKDNLSPGSNKQSVSTVASLGIADRPPAARNGNVPRSGRWNLRRNGRSDPRFAGLGLTTTRERTTLDRSIHENTDLERFALDTNTHEMSAPDAFTLEKPDHDISTHSQFLPKSLSATPIPAFLYSVILSVIEPSDLVLIFTGVTIQRKYTAQIDSTAV
ncbi:hypothetical protein BX600DRAFT_510173 [Xylariales sp. PMI_506]|nr:hypothetical protein BX600DRAFT_510173 [Xylariales sp. PMI_506]